MLLNFGWIDPRAKSNNILRQKPLTRVETLVTLTPNFSIAKLIENSPLICNMPIKVIKTKPEFVDERGYITRLVDTDKYPIRAVMYITGKKGAVRGNHYHKTDAHYVFCLSGKFRYYEKKSTKKNTKVESVILKPGDVVLSKPGVIHAMKFLEDTVFLAVTTEPREQKKYEADIERIKIA